jgi:hypothetical protein
MPHAIQHHGAAHLVQGCGAVAQPHCPQLLCLDALSLLLHGSHVLSHRFMQLFNAAYERVGIILRQRSGGNAEGAASMPFLGAARPPRACLCCCTAAHLTPIRCADLPWRAQTARHLPPTCRDLEASQLSTSRMRTLQSCGVRGEARSGRSAAAPARPRSCMMNGILTSSKNISAMIVTCSSDSGTAGRRNRNQSRRLYRSTAQEPGQ